jgi:hypothetical protein
VKIVLIIVLNFINLVVCLMGAYFGINYFSGSPVLTWWFGAITATFSLCLWDFIWKNCK